MSTADSLTRPPGARPVPLVLLGLSAAVLAVGFVVGPRLLAARGRFVDLADPAGLAATFQSGFVRFWREGGAVTDPDLARATSFWGEYHLAKAGFAALLMVSLILVARGLFRAVVAARSWWSTVALMSVLTAVTVLGFFAALLVMANVQGLLAPFAGLFPTLSGAQGDAAAGAVREAQRHLMAGGPASDSGALAVMVADFVRFHVVLAVLAVAFAGILATTAVLMWRNGARSTRRRERWLLRGFALGGAAAAALVFFLGVVNVSTAVQPYPALAGALAGGL